MKVECPNCKLTFILTLPAYAAKQHILCHCSQCEEPFVQHQDFQKSISMDKNKIGEFINNQDMLGMATYLVSRVEQMEAEVISKVDILKLQRTLDTKQDVSEVIKKL